MNKLGLHKVGHTPKKYIAIKFTSVCWLALISIGLTHVSIAQQPIYLNMGDSQALRSLQWIGEAPTEFKWAERYRSRTPAEQVGAESQVITFSIPELAPGNYSILVKMDAGREDSSQVQLHVNQLPVNLNLQTFRQPAEPYLQNKPQFRVAQFDHHHTDGALALKLSHPTSSVRLLSVDILPHQPTDTDRQRWIFQMIREAGTYLGRALPLGEIIWQLEQYPGKAWSAYWLAQVQLLHRAEQLFELKGWEWARKRDGMTLISRSQQVVMLLDPLVQDRDHPLYERALILKSKVLYHLNHEYGGKHEFDDARTGLSQIAASYPHDTILKMYVGERFVQMGKSAPPPDSVPAWAHWQRRCMSKLRPLVGHWVADRQAPNGEMGGKLGDDVEALRFWEPLLYSKDSLATLGWSRLYNGVWHSSHLHEGYASRVADVEHAAEFISDTGPAMLLISDSEETRQRARKVYHHFDTLWSGINDDGHRFFRSAWYSSTDMDLTPPKNRDVDYNARALKILRFLLFRYPQENAVQSILEEWSHAWVEKAKSTAKGKPPGILPPSIVFPSGEINDTEESWWKSNMLWEYFDFTGAALLLDQCLFMYSMTDNPEFLAPIKASIALVQDHPATSGALKEGSAAWAAAQYRGNRHWWSVISQLRLLHPDASFDQLLLDEAGSGYVKYCLTNDESHLVEELQVLHTALSTNWPMLTSEVMFTDRIYGYYPDGLSRLQTNLLKSMLTGDVCLWGTSPYMLITWESLPTDCSVLVRRKDGQGPSIQVYNHSSEGRTLKARLWHLPKTEHQVTVGDQGNQALQVDPDQAYAELTLDIGPGLNYVQINRQD